jgi:hypothetical protein
MMSFLPDSMDESGGKKSMTTLRIGKVGRVVSTIIYSIIRSLSGVLGLLSVLVLPLAVSAQDGAGAQARIAHLPSLPERAWTHFAPVTAVTVGDVVVPRGTILERMTRSARIALPASAFYHKTWVTYYGRPGIEVMGILGEYEIAELIPLLHEQAAAYDEANGARLDVQPAFHLVYGMATKAAGEDNSHLAYIDDTTVISYVQAAADEGFAVILDVQIGALSPSQAISPALAYLEYPNVHLAIDPEFAMVHAGQSWPGNPIGYVTAAQVNEVQATIRNYLRDHQLEGPRVLLVHQFLDTMVVDPENLDWGYADIDLTVSVDGWGGPWGKISKYNAFVTPEIEFAAFKLFYRWDEPLLSPEVALGEQPYAETDMYMDVTPNLIIYQ